MRRTAFLMIALLLVAGPAWSQVTDIGTPLPKSGEPGYSADFDSTDAAGTYFLGYTLGSMTYDFTHGAGYVGALWDCTTRTASPSTADCDKVTDLTSADETGTYTGKKRVLMVVVATSEDPGSMSTLVVHASHSLGTGSGVDGVSDLATTGIVAGRRVVQTVVLDDVDVDIETLNPELLLGGHLDVDTSALCDTSTTDCDLILPAVNVGTYAARYGREICFHGQNISGGASVAVKPHADDRILLGATALADGVGVKSTTASGHAGTWLCLTNNNALGWESTGDVTDHESQ